MNRYLTLFLALLLITATAFSMGCTETENNSSEEGIAEESNETSGNEVSENNSLQGMIIFDEPVESFSNAIVYLEAEDISLQDVESTLIAEETIDDISLDADDPESVPYMISYPDLDERMSYSLSVHVDVDGDGTLSSGDYYSPWNNPVPTEPGTHELDVHVELI
ncbi:MAG: hypothetical protein AWU59_1975 [Methanolobus sp. T82-4]|nr:MAG: hypothetical protein AWU59_1975 [Methanolobus sp. T82-4]